VYLASLFQLELRLVSVPPGILRSPKPITTVCGAISSLGRRRVPE
jgi:hypothetical protein